MLNNSGYGSRQGAAPVRQLGRQSIAHGGALGSSTQRAGSFSGRAMQKSSSVMSYDSASDKIHIAKGPGLLERAVARCKHWAPLVVFVIVAVGFVVLQNVVNQGRQGVASGSVFTALFTPQLADFQNTVTSLTTALNAVGLTLSMLSARGVTASAQDFAKVRAFLTKQLWIYR